LGAYCAQNTCLFKLIAGNQVYYGYRSVVG